MYLSIYVYTFEYYGKVFNVTVPTFCIYTLLPLIFFYNVASIYYFVASNFKCNGFSGRASIFFRYAKITLCWTISHFLMGFF